jgi:putative photosynthetic complex assembly protein
MNAERTRPRQPGFLPTWLLIAAAVMIFISIAAAAYSRYTGYGRVSLQGAQPYKTLQLRFEDMPNGGVGVRDAERGDVIYVVEPGKGGFLRATLRTFAQARRRDDIGSGTPFRLTRWTDGTLSLEDPTTGRGIGLDAFGPDNAGVFAQLFTRREEIK